MTFAIAFSDEEIDEPDRAHGRIRLGADRERFYADLSWWDRPRYEQQWLYAIHRILDGADRSCLLTSVADPAVASGVEWWPLYREGDSVYVQHGMAFFDQHGIVDLDDPYPRVPSRAPNSARGEVLSEWRVSVRDLDDFLTNSGDPAAP